MMVFSYGAAHRRVFVTIIASLLISALATFAYAQEVKTGVFEFSTWDGPTLKIHFAEPAASSADAPIVFVMHGAGRNADDYRDNWIDLAQKYDLRIYAPEFDKKRFPKSRAYNTGGLTLEKDRAITAIDPLFDAVKARGGSTQNG